MPRPAFSLEDGHGHLGAMALEHGEASFLSGEEAASRLGAHAHLLRFVAVREGRPLGGYSVVVFA